MKRFRSRLLAILFLTAAYIFVWPAANVPYFAAVLLHLVAGIVLVVVLALSLRSILPAASPAQRIAWPLLALGGVLGLVLMFTGTRKSDWPLLFAHVGACIAGGALLLSAWAGRRGFMVGSYLKGAVRGGVFVIAAVLVTMGAWWVRTVPWERANRIENPQIAPATMNAEGDGPSGALFPQFRANQARRPHPRRLFHRIGRLPALSRGHLSPMAKFRASLLLVQQRLVPQEHRVHAGHRRHSALEVVRRMPRPRAAFQRHVRPADSRGGGHPAGQAGLGCMMCHSFVKVKSSMGQGDYELEYPVMHRLAASKNPFVRRATRFSG